MTMFIKHCFRIVRNIILLAICACVLAFVVLSVAEIPLPARVIDTITARISTDSTTVHVQRATLSLHKGLALGTAQIRMTLATNDLFVQAQEVRFDFSIRPGRPWTEWIDGIHLHHPQAEFIPSARLLPQDDFAPSSFLKNLKLSRVFVELTEPLFAGIEPERLTANLSLHEQALVFENLRIDWHSAQSESITGRALFNPKAGVIEVTASGQVAQKHIRPILVYADSPPAIHYCDRITSPDVPLAVSCSLRLTPETHTFRFEINGRSITWNHIPIMQTTCVIAVSNRVGQEAWQVTLSPLNATTTNGTAKATLVYTQETGLLAVDAQSDMPVAELLDIIEVLNDGTLDRVVFAGVPHMTLSGTIDADSTRTLPYDLRGTIRAPGLDLYGLPLAQTVCDFSVQDQYRVSFENIHAKLDRGGELTGKFAFTLTTDEPEIPYRADLAFSDVTLHDLFLPLSKTNTWEGGATLAFALAGDLATNQLASLSGHGAFAMTGGVISRVPLFAGFTDYLASAIPGVEAIISQSDASFSFQVTNGVAHSSDILVEGNIFSLSGKGSYTLQPDNLDVIVRANIFRKDTFAGHVTRIVTFPFARLLLEFHVTGPTDKTRWNYKGIIQRIVDSVSGSESKLQKNSDTQDTTP